AVAAVHDLRQEVAFDAVDAPIDLRLDVAMGGNDLVVAGAHHDAASGAAETAGRLVPAQVGRIRFGDQVGGAAGNGDASSAGGDGRGIGLGELATGEAHQASPSVLRSSW